MTRLRTKLTDRRIELRHNQRDLEDAKRLAEDTVIADAGGEKALGPNAEARTRTLAAGLAKQIEYQAALATVQGLQDHIERIATALENAVDERRDREWAIRERLAAALDGRGIMPRDVEDPFEEVIDDQATRVADTIAEALTDAERLKATSDGASTSLDGEAILEAARLADVMDGAR